MKHAKADNGLAGLTLAKVSRTELARSIVAGVAAYLRTGVDVRLLDGLAAIRSLDSIVAVDRLASRREQLETELASCRRRAANARALAAEEEVLADSDPDAAATAQEYRADARRLSGQARQLAQTLAGLEAAPSDHVRLADSFETDSAMIVEALSCILSDDGLVSETEMVALGEVLVDFRFTNVLDMPRRLEWELYLRVLSGGSVLRVGPITGDVERFGRDSTPAELESLRGGDVSMDPFKRFDRAYEIERAGYSRLLSLVASKCPWPDLGDALTGAEPDWGTPQRPGFDPHRFNKHLRASYSADVVWGRRNYSNTNPQRQALVDLTAAMGGTVRTDQVAAAADRLGLKRTDASRCSILIVESNTPPWPPAVARSGPWAPEPTAGHNALVSIRCPACGDPATAVVRVLEVPDALLCKQCLIAPGLPGLVFPACYLDLALPPKPIGPALLAELHALEPQYTHARVRTRTSRRRTP